MSNYPEHERLRAISDKSQVVGEFLNWLDCRSPALTLCYLDERTEDYFPVMTPINTLLAEFFEIDQDLLEKEKLAMLKELRKPQESRDEVV